MRIPQIYNHCKGASTLRLEKEKEREQMGCWAPPLHSEVPHDLQELGRKGNQEVHSIENYEPSV